jgi:hypothetical protein
MHGSSLFAQAASREGIDVHLGAIAIWINESAKTKMVTTAGKDDYFDIEKEGLWSLQTT